MTSTIGLSGLGLHLREWADADLPVMVELFDDPEVSRWTPLPSPFDLTAARTYLDQARARRAEGRSIQLAITTDGHAALGEILLVDADRTAELAYAVGRAHRGQGLTTRAVRLMTAYAYGELAMQTVVLRIDPDNVPSVAVARATGFQRTGDEPITRRGSRPLETWRHLPSPE
jgi:RimJ/RimL family protein N-acetyltransferase